MSVLKLLCLLTFGVLFAAIVALVFTGHDIDGLVILLVMLWVGVGLIGVAAERREQR